NDAVERARLDHLPKREFDSEGLQIILERDQLLAAWRLVDPVHHGRLLRFERARRRYVRGDHEILDEAVRIETITRRDRQDAPLLVKHHSPLRQVELERVALLPGGE